MLKMKPDKVLIANAFKTGIYMPLIKKLPLLKPYEVFSFLYHLLINYFSYENNIELFIEYNLSTHSNRVVKYFSLWRRRRGQRGEWSLPLPHHTTRHHSTPLDITPHHSTSLHTTPHHTNIHTHIYHTTPHHTTPYYTTSHQTKPNQTKPN